MNSNINMKKSLGQLSRQFHKEGRDPVEVIVDLRTLLNEFDPAMKDAKKCLSMMANMAISDMEFCKELVAFGASHDLLTEQVYTALIRSLCDAGQIDLAIATVRTMIEINVSPHVRSFLPFYTGKLGVDQYLDLYGYLNVAGITPTTELFSLLIARVPDSVPVDFVKGLILRAGQHCNLLDPVVSEGLDGAISNVSERGMCTGCHEMLGLVDLTQPQRTLMMGSVFEDGANPAIVRWLETRSYDVVIDGANVAHYNNSPFDLRKVVNMVNKLTHSQLFQRSRILIVFAQCRRKLVRSLEKKWKNVDVFYSRVNTNDDHSWLYAALSNPRTLCITNDQMRDHVYYRFTEVVGRNVIDLWMERQVVSFRFNITQGFRRNQKNVQIEIDIPLSYSFRPQVAGNGNFHIPLSDGTWFCTK